MNHCHHSVSMNNYSSVSLSDLLNKIGYVNKYPFIENLPLQYYPSVNGDTDTLLTISHDTNLSSSWTFNVTAGVITSNYLSSSLSVNGSRLASDASKFNVSQIAIESNILKLVLSFRYNFSDEGFYIHYLYFSDPYDLYDVLRDQSHRCRYLYVYAGRYLGLYPMSFAIFTFILTTYSKYVIKKDSLT